MKHRLSYLSAHKSYNQCVCSTNCTTAFSMLKTCICKYAQPHTMIDQGCTSTWHIWTRSHCCSVLVHCLELAPPTLSRGISLSSEPCFRKTFPAVCEGLMPTPSACHMHVVLFVIQASHVLRWSRTHTICKNSAGLCWHLELQGTHVSQDLCAVNGMSVLTSLCTALLYLFCSILHDCRERGLLRHAEPATPQHRFIGTDVLSQHTPARPRLLTLDTEALDPMSV